jgi:L-asparaginase
MMTPMPRLLVVTTGGTISTSADSEGVLRPRRTGAELVAGLGADVVDLLAVDSSQLTPADWLRIGQTVSEAVASGADGVVITHGTDTLEETALWLELSYGGSAPVVLTGAARSADSSDPDGPRNLRDALTVAASAAARDNGVLICFGGAVLAPLGTTKIGGPEFFGGTPAVGAVSGGTFELTRAKPRAFLSPLESAPRVDIAAAYPGADGTAIDAFVAAGARGLVVEAVGAGNAGPNVVDAVGRACSRGVAVVIASRVYGSRTSASYGPGHDLVEAGAILVPGIKASQARVLVMAALSAGLPIAEILTRWG